MPSAGARSPTGCPASAPLPSLASDHGAAAATGSTVTVAADDFFFAPTCITEVPAGTITLTVRNATQTLHNVTIESLGVDTDVPGAQAIDVKVRVGSSALPFVCKYHRTSGMVGVLLPSID